jgi:hypothetical protein
MAASSESWEHKSQDVQTKWHGWAKFLTMGYRDELDWKHTATTVRAMRSNLASMICS